MIKHTKDWIPYTISKTVAMQFKVRDNKQIHFIKNPRYKEYLRIHGSWKKFYKFVKPYFVLPPSVGWIIWSDTVYEWIYPGGLYDRQKEAVDFVVEMYNKKKRSCFIVSGTGTGKWHITPAILNSLHGEKIIVLAPNDVVASRLMDDLAGIAKYVRGKKILKSLNERVVVTLYKTFNLYVKELNEEFWVVLIDEGHHVWGQLEDGLYTRRGFICWMSATPYRNEYNEDGFKMFFWNILDTQKQALPVEVYEHKFKYEYNEEAVIKAQEGIAPTSPELYRRLVMGNDTRYDELALVISNIKEKRWLRNFIVFSDRLDHIARIEEYLTNEFPKMAIIVVKGESDQMKIMEELKWKQDIIIVGSTAVVKEGMNIPQLEVWILFTSASFRGGIDQMAGRVRRYYGEKKCWYFIDFQDYISIAWSKYKSPWVYSRRKAYKSFWWKIGNLTNDFIW